MNMVFFRAIMIDWNKINKKPLMMRNASIGYYYTARNLSIAVVAGGSHMLAYDKPEETLLLLDLMLSGSLTAQPVAEINVCVHYVAIDYCQDSWSTWTYGMMAFTVFAAVFFAYRYRSSLADRLRALGRRYE
jgi:hypothetical protein